MESIAELNARGQRYNNLSGTLYMLAIIGLILLVAYSIYTGQYLIGVAMVIIGLMFLASVALEVRGDAALDKADQLYTDATPSNH